MHHCIILGEKNCENIKITKYVNVAVSAYPRSWIGQKKKKNKVAKLSIFLSISQKKRYLVALDGGQNFRNLSL